MAASRWCLFLSRPVPVQGRRSSCVLRKGVKELWVTAMELKGHIKLTWNYPGHVRVCVCVSFGAYIAHSIKVHKLCPFTSREEGDDEEVCV